MSDFIYIFFLYHGLSKVHYHYSHLGPQNYSSEKFCGTVVEPFGKVLVPNDFSKFMSSAALNSSVHNELQHIAFFILHGVEQIL